ncbi:WD40 repeat-like protein, partial [Polyporus arcularius HHB13444]
AASPDGRYFATGADDGAVIVWSGKTAPERTLVEMQCPAESRGVRSLHFSDNGELLAGVCNLKLLIWRGRLADGFSLHVVLHRRTKVTAACISPCERYVVTASQDCTIWLWSTRDGECLWIFRDGHSPTTHLLFSPDGRFLASGDKKGIV